jgi:iron complex transport system ATP-binding protein
VLACIDRPQAGFVELDGHPIADFHANERARLLAFLPQPSEAAWPVTVERLVALGRLPFLGFGGMTAADRQAVDRALALTSLEDLRQRSMTSLSAGEASRAFLARALAGEPRILLADEPTANLDPAHQLTVMQLLRTLADQGTAIVLIQHDLPLAGRFCDRLALIGGGRLVAEGAPQAVLEPAQLAAVFGVAARYGDEAGGGFFALPWSLVRTTRSDDIEAP